MDAFTPGRHVHADTDPAVRRYFKFMAIFGLNRAGGVDDTHVQLLTQID